MTTTKGGGFNIYNKLISSISFSPPFGGVGGGYEMFLNIFLKRKPLRKPLR